LQSYACYESVKQNLCDCQEEGQRNNKSNSRDTMMHPNRKKHMVLKPKFKKIRWILFTGSMFLEERTRQQFQ